MGNRFLYTITGDVLTLRGVMSRLKGLDMLALVDLLLVGDDANWLLSFGWMDVWELNPDLGLLWLKTSATLGGRGDDFG
jgi:hypothetical protein